MSTNDEKWFIAQALAGATGVTTHLIAFLIKTGVIQHAEAMEYFSHALATMERDEAPKPAIEQMRGVVKLLKQIEPPAPPTAH